MDESQGSPLWPRAVSMRAVERIGSYRLRKRLAAGGMGELFLAEKIGPEGFVKPVVLKCVLPSLVKDKAFIKLFEDEARLAALLNHPNIAQIYDFGVEDGTYYLVMEYVPGYTVDDIRRKLRSIGQFMPLQHIACIASQVCQGLHYAHTLTDGRGESIGLVHRDVSPHNLIVSIDGSVKLVDFGIAKARAGLTRVQAKGAVGKFGYMSPEQAQGGQVAGSSDVFSLGVCLWELTTNQRLNDPKLEEAPPYDPAHPLRGPETVRPELPRQFLQILQRALAIRVSDRFSTAEEMHLALERFQVAMTHYAGQAALAHYIRDLVEGKVEASKTPAPPEPGEQAISPVERRQLEGAQRYEEVFGSTRPEPPVERDPGQVPDSWRLPQPKVEAPIPTLDLDRSVPDRLPPRSRPARQSVSVERRLPPKKRRGLRWVLLLLLLLIAGLGAVGFFWRDAILQAIPGMQTPAAPRQASYRFETKPKGASVVLNGKARGRTPILLDLEADTEYHMQLRKAGYESAELHFTASVAHESRVIRFDLKRKR